MKQSPTKIKSSDIYTAAVIFAQSNCTERIIICDIQSLTVYRLVYDIDNAFP